MSARLLLDENVTPKGALALHADGVDACHVRDRGLLGATDADLLEWAYNDDRILVTSNVCDFEKLARSREIHAGIVLIERAGQRREEQIKLLREVAIAISEHGPMLNEVLRVDDDGAMTFEVMPT